MIKVLFSVCLKSPLKIPSENPPEIPSENPPENPLWFFSFVVWLFVCRCWVSCEQTYQQIPMIKVLFSVCLLVAAAWCATGTVLRAVGKDEDCNNDDNNYNKDKDCNNEDRLLLLLLLPIVIVIVVMIVIIIKMIIIMIMIIMRCHRWNRNPRPNPKHLVIWRFQ